MSRQENLPKGSALRHLQCHTGSKSPLLGREVPVIETSLLKEYHATVRSPAVAKADGQLAGPPCCGEMPWSAVTHGACSITSGETRKVLIQELDNSMENPPSHSLLSQVGVSQPKVFFPSEDRANGSSLH